jgi:hypothetical protein
MTKQMTAGLIVAGCLGAAAAFVLLSRAPRVTDAPVSYASEQECRDATGAGRCSFVMCDLIPAGKTFEETCGRGFHPGWQPR